MNKKIIKNTITGETTAVIATEGIHLIEFIEETLESDDVFQVAEADGKIKVPVAELAAYDNYDREEAPELAAVFIGNLDDADLLVGMLNGMPFSDYFMVRKPVGFCTDNE